MKIVVDKAASRGYFDHGWLKTYHTFSFAEYYNPDRMHFGALRVLNDDRIAPSEGFGTHSHKNMEVISIPLKGYLKHGDSEENNTVIGPGDIQVMSAGTGIYHSEFNGSDKEPVEFLQIWVLPQKMNTTPKYQNYDIRDILVNNTFALFISPDGKSPASILQNAWFSIGTFESNRRIDYQLHGEDMGVYVFIIQGEVEIARKFLSVKDGIGISETSSFQIKVLKESTLLLIEVPMIL